MLKRFFIIMVFLIGYSDFAEARICNVGAENFYHEFVRMLPPEYGYTDLIHNDEVNKEFYFFKVKNERYESMCNIALKSDVEGFVYYIAIVTSLPNMKNVVPICLHRALRTMGMSEKEIVFLTSNLKITKLGTKKISEGEIFFAEMSRRIKLDMFVNETNGEFLTQIS